MAENTIPIGARVFTPHGVGAVAYVRMAPPNYDTPEAYSVRLYGRITERGYEGTIVPAADVDPSWFDCERCGHEVSGSKLTGDGWHMCGDGGFGPVKRVENPS